MARDFDGTSGYLEHAAATVITLPVTMVAWFNNDDATTAQAVISLGTGGGTARVQLALIGSVAGDPIRATSMTAGGVGVDADSGTGYVAGQWMHAAAVFASTTSRTAYVNGVAGTANTVSNDPSASGWDRLVIGARISAGAYGAFQNGKLADIAIWNEALTAPEIRALSQGLHPDNIRPSSRVAFYPLDMPGAISSDQWSGKYHVTRTGIVWPYQQRAPRATRRLVSAQRFRLSATSAITINAIADALIIAEQVAAVEQAININGIVDALIIAEQAAVVAQSINVNAVVDALVIAEQMAVVSVGGSMTINAVVDALIIAEQLSVVSIPIAVTAVVDTLVIAEQAAAVAQGINVNAVVDTLALAEQAAVVVQAITLTAVVDSLVISEQVAAISLGSSLAINAAVDTLVIAEQTATITLEITINGVAETLVFTEYAATIALSSLGGVEVPSTALLRSYAALEIPELFHFATSELGETITINGIAKYAIGVTPYQNVPFGEIGMAGRISEFMIDAASFDAAVGIIDSLVVMRGITYAIERIQRLDSGVVIAELSR